MDEKELTPSESLEIISVMIEKAKTRFQENGFIFMFWGIVTMICSSAQFILLFTKYQNYHYYPYFIMPFAFIFSLFYFRKKRLAINRQNIIIRTMRYGSFFIGLNLMIIGFFLHNKLGIAHLPVMLLLIGLMLVFAGLLIRSNMIIYSGVIINILSFFCLFIPWIYQPLIFALSAIIGLVIPGLLLYLRQKKENV